MKKLFLTILLLALAGCSSVNFANTVAGGACGFVDYSLTVVGAPLFSIKATRECPEEKTSEE